MLSHSRDYAQSPHTLSGAVSGTSPIGGISSGWLFLFNYDAGAPNGGLPLKPHAVRDNLPPAPNQGERNGNRSEAWQ